ncbi:MAG: hypothetical protein ACI8X5_001804 [Planctomycetota bacterium]|jgi:hypothetical protein
MKTPLLIIASLLLLPLSSCSDAPESEPQADSTAAKGAQQKLPANQGTPADPFQNPVTADAHRVTTLPEGAYFKEYQYPGSKVIDAKEVFGSTTVWLLSKDEYKVVDAFYAKKFTDEDGELEGNPGRYYRFTEDGGRERTSISERTGGGTEIIISK